MESGPSLLPRATAFQLCALNVFHIFSFSCITCTMEANPLHRDFQILTRNSAGQALSHETSMSWSKCSGDVSSPHASCCCWSDYICSIYVLLPLASLQKSWDKLNAQYYVLKPHWKESHRFAIFSSPKCFMTKSLICLLSNSLQIRLTEIDVLSLGKGDQRASKEGSLLIWAILSLGRKSVTVSW